MPRYVRYWDNSVPLDRPLPRSLIDKRGLRQTQAVPDAAPVPNADSGLAEFCGIIRVGGVIAPSRGGIAPSSVHRRIAQRITITMARHTSLALTLALLAAVPAVSHAQGSPDAGAAPVTEEIGRAHV